MDAGYDNVKSDGKVKHPLSAWTTTQFQSVLLRDNAGFKDHIEQTYRAFGTIKDMRKIQKTVSQVSAWDDHEIRDGWGSQEDEYQDDNMTLTDRFKPVLMSAKEGFINHQLLTGPRSFDANSLLGNLSSMEQKFTVGSYKGFVLDLRTTRNVMAPRVIDAKQKNAFIDWLNNEVKESDPIIIISSMPLFLSNYSFIENLANFFNAGEKDDVNDGWASDQNYAERVEILSLILEARVNRDIKPIFVSGDYHKGAISEIWYTESGKCNKKHEQTKKVFGYELVASGLYHEGVADKLSAKGFDKIENQRLGGHFIQSITHSKLPGTFCLDPFVNMSVVQENFGGLTVYPGKKDVLKLVGGNQYDNTGQAFEMVLDWDKPFDRSIEKQYLTAYQKSSNNIGRLFNYDAFTPRPPKVVPFDLDEITPDKP
jgi:hypothetical protein